jgi:hypothetical protein
MTRRQGRGLLARALLGACLIVGTIERRMASKVDAAVSLARELYKSGATGAAISSVLSSDSLAELETRVEYCVRRKPPKQMSSKGSTLIASSSSVRSRRSTTPARRLWPRNRSLPSCVRISNKNSRTSATRSRLSMPQSSGLSAAGLVKPLQRLERWVSSRSTSATSSRRRHPTPGLTRQWTQLSRSLGSPISGERRDRIPTTALD